MAHISLPDWSLSTWLTLSRQASYKQELSQQNVLFSGPGYGVGLTESGTGGVDGVGLTVGRIVP